MLEMVPVHAYTDGFRGRRSLLKWLLAAAVFVCVIAPSAGRAQNESGGTDAGSCTLNDHVYTCNGAAFQIALQSANTVAIEVHNADGVARAQLTNLITKKLGKIIAAHGSPANLIFFVIPIDPSGVVNGAQDANLGTLRIYSPTPDGTRGHLLWAETYSGTQDLPWPAVVHGLILQFQSHFHIK